MTSLVMSAIVCVIFLILLLLKKKRINWVASLLLVVSIVFFSILQPSGRILFSLGSFHITAGAILFGLEKAAKLLAIVYISQYAISRDVKLPGNAGVFLRAVFLYFDRLTEYKKSFNFKSPIASIDAILLDVYNSDSQE